MKSGGERSQFFFLPFPVFFHRRGRIAHAAHLAPISLPRPHVANPSSPPPPPGRGSPPRAPAASLPPEPYVPAACSGRRIPGALLLWPLPHPPALAGVLSPRPGARPVAGAEAASFTLRRRGRYFPLSAPSPEDRPRSVVWDLDR